jgi:dihydrofolate reductase
MTTSAGSRKLMLRMGMSLDGFVAVPSGDGLTPVMEGGSGLAPEDPELTRTKVAWLWARLMNTLPKVVFSKSLPVVDWNNARLSRRPLQDEIPELKREPGTDMIVFGGARIAHSLIRDRLVDEYRLTVHPVALGAGLSLMHGLPEPQRLELISSTAYADGCVAQVLRPT